MLKSHRVALRPTSEQESLFLQHGGFARFAYNCGAEVITDVASGLNYRRKGLATILERLHSGDKLTLVVAYRDRLARFGTELIEQMLEQNGGQLVVLNQRDLSPPEELTQDLLAILTVFSARANGLRKYRKKIQEDKSLPRPATESQD